MKIRVLGGGWYGAHISLALSRSGHAVELHEIDQRLFRGASGSNPARLHLGFHYPRSRLTRAACQEHQAEFMSVYGRFTKAIPVNIYAIAAHDSVMDFGTYCQVLKGEVEFIRVPPADFGLTNVEGALLTGERHIIVDEVRDYFQDALKSIARYMREPGEVDDKRWDYTIDCTFCANDQEAIDRYEPCVIGILEGPTVRAVTIMDGPFGSIYPWNERLRLSSLSSALLTPLSKACRTHAEAQAILATTSQQEFRERVQVMMFDMAKYWPDSNLFEVVDFRTGIRAMPRSGADARLVDVVRVGERALRVRAGKIDAIFSAERKVREMIGA